MNKYTIPADFKIDNIYRMGELNKSFTSSKILEVYGQLTDGGSNSGRSIDTLPQIEMDGLEKYVKELNKHNIQFNYTINQSCSSNNEFSKKTVQDITQLVNNLWNIGVSGVTIALPSIIEIVRTVRPELEIKASAICEINSVHKALFYKRLGAQRIVVDTDLTRRFDVLSSISRAFGDGVEIIVTNMCHNNCPYKMFHYNHTAHRKIHENNEAERDFYDNRCFLQFAEEPDSAMKLNWVRPEDIHLYKGIGINYFKIDGRDHVLSGDYIKTIYDYFTEKYDGNLFNLLYFYDEPQVQLRYLDNRKLDGFIDAFVENPGMCTGICEECGYCSKYVESTPLSKMTARSCNIMAKNLRKVDKFNMLLQECQ